MTRISELTQTLRTHPLRARVEEYVRLARWHRPLDLMLMSWSVLAASWLAGDGAPDGAAVAALLAAIFLLRSAAHIWLSQPEVQVQYHPEVKRVALAVAVAGLCFTLPLGWPLLLLPLSLLSVWGALFFQRRTYLAQTGLALGVAWLVPAAWTAQGVIPGKAAWLLFVAVLFWATALVVLFYLPRPAKDADEGLLTLPMLFGGFARRAVGGFQLLSLLAFYLLGRQAELEIFFTLGLMSAAALTAYQQFLLYNRADREGWQQALRANVWWGVAVFCGVAFHYLCACR